MAQPDPDGTKPLQLCSGSLCDALYDGLHIIYTLFLQLQHKIYSVFDKISYHISHYLIIIGKQRFYMCSHWVSINNFDAAIIFHYLTSSPYLPASLSVSQCIEQTRFLISAQGCECSLRAAVFVMV